MGDNDATWVYVRYRDVDFWCLVTICGENNKASWRAPYGVSIQKRTNGLFTELMTDTNIATDPTDIAWYKRVRLAVTASGSNFEVRTTGWSWGLEPPGWDEGFQSVLTFQDVDHADGRVGVGLWGQSGGGSATATNPVDAGALIEDVVVNVNSQEVFREDWEAVPLAAEIGRASCRERV
mgnify:FL=1